MQLLMNKEDAMLKPSEHYSIRKIDFEVGDIVQVKSKGKYTGRIGRIIGTSIRMVSGKILYTVQFNDKESIAVSGYGLSFLSKTDS